MTNAIKAPSSQAVAPLGARLSGDTQAVKLINSVRKNIGEAEGANNANPYTAKVSGNANLPWCAAFVSVKLQEAGIGGFRSSSCRELAGQFRAAGKYTPPSTPPQPGDVIFFGSPEHHTGIVQKVENGKVYTVEGNSSDKVSERVYDLSNPGISGYGKVFAPGTVSNDLGFDTSGATRGGSGGRPSGRSQGAGSAGRATDTGLDAGAYPANYNARSMHAFLMALLHGNASGLLDALKELYPFLSEEDLKAMAEGLLANPEIASALIANPEGTLEALKNDSSPEGIAALASAPIAKGPANEASTRLIKDLERSELSPAAQTKLDAAMESVPRPPKPTAWQPR